MALAGGIGGGLRAPRISLLSRLLGLNWPLVWLVATLAAIGFAMLVSAANGSIEPWAWRRPCASASASASQWWWR